IFKAALFIGNITNFIKKRDPIVAYSLENFDQLMCTKSNDNSTLLKFIINNHYDIEEELPLVNDFEEVLRQTCTVSISSLRIEIDNIMKKIEICESIVSSTDKLEEYKGFHKECLELIGPYEEKFSEIAGLIAKIRNIYCIDQSLETEKFFLIYKNIATQVKISMTEILNAKKKQEKANLKESTSIKT
ncbi:hypothetical protein HZS_4288, partial [Henneguya salminicola]